MAVTVAVAYAVHADLHGEGIRDTLLFELLGNAAFVVFYGCTIALLIGLVRMFPLREHWMNVSGGMISVGHRQIPLDEVSGIEVRPNWIGLRQLVLCRPNGRSFKTKVYLLSRPVSEVMRELKSLVADRDLRKQIAGH